MDLIPEYIKQFIDGRHTFEGGQVYYEFSLHRFVGEIVQIAYDPASDIVSIRPRQIVAQSLAAPGAWKLAWDATLGVQRGFETYERKLGFVEMNAKPLSFLEGSCGVTICKMDAGTACKLIPHDSRYLFQYTVRTPEWA